MAVAERSLRTRRHEHAHRARRGMRAVRRVGAASEEWRDVPAEAGRRPPQRSSTTVAGSSVGRSSTVAVTRISVSVTLPQ